MKVYFFIFFYFCIGLASAQWHIILTGIPTNTPVGEPIYIAGNFNQWNPGDQNYKLTQDENGLWNIKLNVTPGNYQFKFTRGSWATVEGTTDGKVIGNRTYNYTGGAKELQLTIAGWEDLSGQNQSTASLQVSILSENFYMPQLNTNRKIWLYLPKDYNSTMKHYPVIYMHDGQNLFDKKTSFLEEWRVDESLDSLIEAGDYGCIVVGIENGGAQRINEYTPWPNDNYGGGKGHDYVSFITETLKPYVDNHYRTLPDVEYTGISGSSLGGLISHYAGIVFPEVFGKIGSLSSSFWFSPNIYSVVSTTGVSEDAYFYMSTGTDESANQVNDVRRMADTLIEAGIISDQLLNTVIAGGKHNERLWANEFPNMYNWFWKDIDFFTSIKELISQPLEFNVNRTGDTLFITGDHKIEDYNYVICSLSGHICARGILDEQIYLTTTEKGSMFIFTILKNGKPVFSKKIL